MHTLSARACIRYGWERFSARPGFFISATLIYLLAIIALDSVSGLVFTRSLGSPGVATLANWLVEVVASMGLVALMLKAHDDPARAALGDLWHPHPFWRYLGTYLLFVLVLLCGLVLLIVPGIIWGIMFGFAMYVVIDRGAGPLEALKTSARVTKGHRWMLLRLGALSVLIMLAGALCLVVGLLVALPVATLASVHAYRTLAGASATSS